MSNKYEAQGTIVKIFDTRQVTEKFRVRELVLELPDDKYPQEVRFQVTGDRCQELDQYNKDDVVSVTFNLRGRASTSKKTGETMWWNSLDVWKHSLVKKAEGPISAEDSDSIPF